MSCVELYNVYYNLLKNIFSDLVTQNSNSYNLHLKFDFAVPQVRPVLNGSYFFFYSLLNVDIHYKS